jgi:hypothetical protein
MTTFMDFISHDAFRLPVWRPFSGWAEHGPFAFWLIEQLRPRLVVELGTYAGFSFAAFCEAMERHSVDGRAIAIDTWQGDEHGGFYPEDIYRNLAAHVLPRYGSFIELKRMTFAEALPSVADGTVDLLHVDGRHFYEDVREDYESWVPKLSERAVILFHDTQVRERGFGVFKYWAELMDAHPAHFEFLHGNGLGVLSRGGPLPERLATLMARNLPDQVRDDVRAAYARLGGGLSSLHDAERLKAKDARRRARRKDPIGTLVQSVRQKIIR